MSIRFIAGVLYLLGIMAAGAAPLDEKVKAFEEAVNKSPARTDVSTPPSPFLRMGHLITIDDLNEVLHQGGDEMQLESIISQLILTHPSDSVQQTGSALTRALESQRKTRIAAYETKANGILAKVPDAVHEAKKAADLDEILKSLKSLSTPEEGEDRQDLSPLLDGKINSTFQFVTQWQDYLAAVSSGNNQQAQDILRNILNNRQIDGPTFFPRSELLARMANPGAPISKIGNPTSGMIEADPDVALAKVKKVEDLENAFNEIQHYVIPGTQQPWDFSVLVTLDKARADAVAGLPFTLDFGKIMNGPCFGDQISRIIAMELRCLLPYYFETNVSNPPKMDETVSAYLDRLIATASTDGNLALLQRVLATKVALGNASVLSYTKGTQQFLAGLSQDAGGQYDLAVTSYENAMKEADGFLPLKVVGERLAAIKKDHPEDFEKGITAFLNPDGAFNPAAGQIPPGFPGYYPGYPRPQPIRVNVLPIPMTVSVPAHAPANPTSPAPTNK